MRKIIAIIAGSLLLGSCNDPFKDQVFRAYDEKPVGEWLSGQPEFSMWVEMLRKVDLYHAMNLGASRFTCFVADNDAVQTYLREKTDYESIAEMPDDEVDFLLRYHIINGAKMASANLMLKLSLPTLTGDYLTAGVDVVTQQRYIDNGEGKEPSFLVRRDIETTNGVIHTLDKLLEPLTVSVWGIISGNSDYSIFTGALRASGFDEWLDNTYRTINETTIRENKTVLVVSDEVFRRRGINSLDDLIAYFGGGDPADPESDFYQYVRYHLMDKLNGYAELTTFPSGYKSMTIYSCSEIKGISVLDTGSAIDFNPQAGEESFRIVDGRRDIPAKNGYVHEIDNLGLLPETMAHYVVVWEPTDKVEFQAIPFYRAEKSEGSEVQKFDLIQNDLSIPGIRWESIPSTSAQVWYYSAYVDNGRYLNNDALYWDMGDIGWLEVDIPVLPAGTYTFTIEKSNDADYGGKCNILWDDVSMGSDRNFVNGDKVGSWGNRTLTSEEAHTVRFTVGSVGGTCGFDRIVFVPVE